MILRLVFQMYPLFVLTSKMLLLRFSEFENRLSNSDFSVIYSWILVQLCSFKADKYWWLFNPIQDGLFWGCSRMREPFWPPLPRICRTYPTMMKLGTVISYLMKIQKIYKSRDTSIEFCWHQHVFTRNQQVLLHQEIQI